MIKNIENLEKDINKDKIIDELKEMVKKDQAMRKATFENFKNFDHEVDKENTEKLKKIVEKVGWPRIDVFGKEAVNNAWLIIQHADLDPKFQQKCLDLMKGLDESDVDKADIAYLEDRIRMNTNNKQLYGTQFLDGGQPYPIEDIDELDERRKKMGLGPFEDYKKTMEGLDKDN